MSYDPSEIPMHSSQPANLMEELKTMHDTHTNAPAPASHSFMTPNAPNTHPHTYNPHNYTMANVAVPSPSPPPQSYTLDDGSFDRSDFERFRSSENYWEQCPAQHEGDAAMQPIESCAQGERDSPSATTPGPNDHVPMEYIQAPAQALSEPTVPPHERGNWLAERADSDTYQYQPTIIHTAGPAATTDSHKRACIQVHSSLPSPSPANVPPSSTQTIPLYTTTDLLNHSPTVYMDSGLRRTPAQALAQTLFAGTDCSRTVNGAQHFRSWSDPAITTINMARRDYLASRPSLVAEEASNPNLHYQLAVHDTLPTSQPAQTPSNSSPAQRRQEQQPQHPSTFHEHSGVAKGWEDPFANGMIDIRNRGVGPAFQLSNEKSDGQSAFQSSGLLTRRFDGFTGSAQLISVEDARYQLYDWSSQSGVQNALAHRPVTAYEEYGQQVQQQSAGVASSSGSSPAIQSRGITKQARHELTSRNWEGAASADAVSVPLSSIPMMQAHSDSLLSGTMDNTATSQTPTMYTDPPMNNSMGLEGLYTVPITYSPHPVSNMSSPYSGSHSSNSYSNIQSPFAQRGYMPPNITTPPPPASAPSSLPWFMSPNYPHQHLVSHSRGRSLITSPMTRPLPSSLSVSPVIQSAPLFGQFNHPVPSFASQPAPFPMPDIPNWSPPLTAGYVARPQSHEPFSGIDYTLWNNTPNPTDGLRAAAASGHNRSTTPLEDVPSPSNPTNPKPKRRTPSPLIKRDGHEPVVAVPSPSPSSDNEEVADVHDGCQIMYVTTPDAFPLPQHDDRRSPGSELEIGPKVDNDTLVSLPSIPRATTDQVTLFIERAFPKGTPNYVTRRRALRTVLFSDWKARDIKEPSSKSLLQFVDVVTTPSSTSAGTSSSSGQKRRARASSSSAATTAAARKRQKRWRCAFYLDRVDEEGNQVQCLCGSVRSVQALEHIRRHIKLEPFVCEGHPCPDSQTGCGARYSSLDPLRKHRGGKITCDNCLRGVLPGNMKRHLDNNCHEDTP